MKKKYKIKLLGAVLNAHEEGDPQEWNNPAVGQFNHKTHELIWAEGQCPEYQKHTILHECVHAMENLLNMQFSERDVDNLALGIKSLIQDNPQLIHDIGKKS